MRKLYLLLPALFFVLISFGQTAPILPLDFESSTTNYTFSDFGGGAVTVIANPQSGGINSSATVGKMIKGAPEVYGGSFISLLAPIDFSVNKTFKVKVYMPRVGAKLLLKVENQSNGAVAFEKEATGTLANAWEELTFDYSAINAANQYQKIVLIFDLGTTGDGTANFTYLFDDIVLTAGGGGGGSGLTQMNLPVSFDLTTVDYGLVGFGGAEGSTILTDPTSVTNKVAKVIKSATAELWAGTTVTAVNAGIQTGFSARIPFTVSETKMNARVWSPDAGIKVRLKVEDHNDPTKSVETEATTTMANTWETLEFNFANQASGTAALNLSFNYDKASIFFNFGVTGAVAGEKTYYFDDIQFGGTGAPPPPPNMSPTLPINFESATTSYTFTDFDGGGTTKIPNPQISGINTSANVSKMIKSAGQVWGGSYLSLASPIDFTTGKYFRVKVFMPRVGAKLLLKVENLTDGGIAFEKEATGTVANAWEELFFDYSTINTANQYQKVVLIFDLGTAGDGSANFTYLFDDIQLSSGALAVKLTSFDAKLRGNNAIIKWIGESEIDHDYYEVERSNDGIHFDSRGTVKGNDNSGVAQSYEFSDALNNVPLIIYYRLKMTDKSGRYNYSKIVALNTKGLLNDGKFNSYPNPFTSGIKVTLASNADAMAGIRIISLEGKELVNSRMMVQKGENIIVLKDLEKLSKGNYILEITTPEDRYIQKITKN